MSKDFEDLEFLLRKSVPDEEFVKDFKKKYVDKSRIEDLHSVGLEEILKTITQGNVARFVQLCRSISLLRSFSNQDEVWVDLRNPFKGTNLVIASCKHNSLPILKEIFNEEIWNLFGKNVLPEDMDDGKNDAFYYALRSGNVDLARTLKDDWPGDHFSKHSGKLEEVLSKSYEKLTLRNVPISDEMKMYVEEKLVGLRFFSDSEPGREETLEGILERIELVEEQVSILENECLNDDEVGELFIFVGKSLAFNISILKKQLKSTYSKLPWEEVHYCLVCFILSRFKKIKMNAYICATLNKTKIIDYLSYFIKILAQEKNNIKSNTITVLKKLPRTNREIIIDDILKSFPKFSHLYNDFKKIRDIQSIMKIDDYITILTAANASTRSGQLTIARSLQVIGEHLKSSLESPKLSKDTSDRIVAVLPSSAKKIIVEIRNSLSHCHSLSTRSGIPPEVFAKVQSDVEEIGFYIRNVLHRYQYSVLFEYLEALDSEEDVPQVREAAAEINNLLRSRPYMNAELEIIKKFVQCVEKNLKHVNEHEKEIFQKINSVIENQISTSFIVTDSLSTIRYDNHYNNTSSKCGSTPYVHFGISYEMKYNTNYILDKPEFSSLVSLVSRLNSGIVNEAIRLFNYISGLKDVKKLENLMNNLIKKSKRKKKSCRNNITENDEDIQEDITIENKLLELRSILDNYGFSNKCMNVIKFPMTNVPNLLELLGCGRNICTFVNFPDLEMVLIDIYSILDTLGCLEYNPLFTDDKCPLLVGRNLRNNLAHDNIQSQLLSENNLLSLRMNANHLLKVELPLSRNIGKRVQENIQKLKHNYKYALMEVRNVMETIQAVINGDVDVLRGIVDVGEYVTYRSFNSSNMLHFAAMGTSLEMVEYILEGKLGVNSVNLDGQTPLHMAAARGRSEIARYLVQVGGADVDLQDNRGRSPLHLAVRSGSVDTVQVLISNSANMNVTCSQGYIPIEHAVICNNVNIFKFLKENDEFFHIDDELNSKTLLHLVAERGYKELLDILLESGANVEIRDKDGFTPLHYASALGHVAIVNTLIRNGADINASDNEGNSALHFAIGNSLELLDTLLVNKAQVNNLNKIGVSPLHIATIFNKPNAIKALVNGGGDPNLKIVGRTPLLVAIERKNQDAAEELIENGADVNLTSEEGVTPLHAASLWGFDNIIRHIINKGGEVNFKNGNGNTPLHLACLQSRINAAEILIKYKADISIKNNKGISPVEAAIIGECFDEIHILIKSSNITVCDYDINFLRIAIKFGKIKYINHFIKNNTEITKDDLFAANSYEIIETLIEKIHNPSWLEEAVINAMLNSYTEDVLEILLKNCSPSRKVISDLLLLASMNGYEKTVTMLLEFGAIVSEVDSAGKSALHHAAAGGFVGIVSELLAHNAKVNDTDEEGFTPLYYAAEKGHERVVNILLDNQAHINYHSGCYKKSPLFNAFNNGHINVTSSLINKGLEKETLEIIRVLLPSLILNSHIEILRIVIDKYPNLCVEYKDSNGNSLMHLAAQQNDENLIEVLIDAGINFTSANYAGYKPIHISVMHGCSRSFNFFFMCGCSLTDKNVYNSQSLLHCAVMPENKDEVEQFEIIKYLIAYGLDVNNKDATGGTCLHLAAAHGQNVAVQILLDNGAIYDALDKLGKKPVDMAKSKFVKEILILTDKLFEEVKKNEISLAVTIADTNLAIVNAKDSKKKTLLHYAVAKYSVEFVGVLLMNCADPNALDIDGWSPLHYAAMHSQFETVLTLLCFKATYNPLTNTGEEPIQLATASNIIQLLTTVDKAFQTAQRGHLKLRDMVETLNASSELEENEEYNTLWKPRFSYALISTRNRKQENLKDIAIVSGNIQLLKEITFIEIEWNRLHKSNKALKNWMPGNINQLLDQCLEECQIRK